MIGQSFLPSMADDEERKKRMQGAGPVQEAIKILSLSLPRVQGAQGIAPMPLLTGGGLAGMGGGMTDPVVEAVLRQFGMAGPQQGGMAPSPVITPGAGGGAQGPAQPAQPQAPPKPKIEFMPNPPSRMEPPRDPFGRQSRY